jgi:hypothetical protein
MAEQWELIKITLITNENTNSESTVSYFSPDHYAWNQAAEEFIEEYYPQLKLTQKNKEIITSALIMKLLTESWEPFSESLAPVNGVSSFCFRRRYRVE